MFKTDALVATDRSKDADAKLGRALASAALAVTLTTKAWGSERKDNISAAIAEKAQKADRGAIKARIDMLGAGDKKAYAKVRSLQNRARSEHARLTLPLTFGRADLLPIKRFPTYGKVLGQIKVDHDEAVDELVADWDDMVEAAKISLGEAADRARFPSRDEIGHEFSIEMSFMPLPTAEAFSTMTGVDDDTLLEQLARQYKKDVRACIETTLDEAMSRALVLVQNLHARLSTVDGRFREAAVQNVRELPDILDAFNLVDDPRMAEVSQKLRVLARRLPDSGTLRADRDVRAYATREVKAIADKMAAWGVVPRGPGAVIEGTSEAVVTGEAA